MSNSTEIVPFVQRISSALLTEKHFDMTDVDVETLRAKPKASFLEEQGIHDKKGQVVNNGFRPKHSLDHINIEERRRQRGELPRLAVRPEEVPWDSAYESPTNKGPIQKMMSFLSLTL
jgi:hypothetical protein